MKAFFDTSVLVATFYADHEHHVPSLETLLRFSRKDACCGAHSVAEVYSTLTSMPGNRRVSGHEATLFLGNVRERLTLVALDSQDYIDAMESAAAVHLAGGAIYDALLSQCAVKAKAAVLYTWNTRDFLRLGPAIARRIRRPDQQ